MNYTASKRRITGIQKKSTNFIEIPRFVEINYYITKPKFYFHLFSTVNIYNFVPLHLFFAVILNIYNAAVGLKGRCQSLNYNE